MSLLAMVGTLYWFSLALFVPLIRRSYLCSFLFFYKPAFFSIAHRYVYKLTESNPEQCTCILHSPYVSGFSLLLFDRFSGYLDDLTLQEEHDIQRCSEVCLDCLPQK